MPRQRLSLPGRAGVGAAGAVQLDLSGEQRLPEAELQPGMGSKIDEED